MANLSTSPSERLTLTYAGFGEYQSREGLAVADTVTAALAVTPALSRTVTETLRSSDRGNGRTLLIRAGGIRLSDGPAVVVLQQPAADQISFTSEALAIADVAVAAVDLSCTATDVVLAGDSVQATLAGQALSVLVRQEACRPLDHRKPINHTVLSIRVDYAE